MASEPIQVIQKVAGALEKLEIPYRFAGYFASAVHGVVRAMMDV